MVNFFIKNRRGWIKVLEVFVSILLVMGFIVLLLNKGYFAKDISDEVYSMQTSIFRDIQLNESLRSAVIGASLPSNWSDFNSGDLVQVRDEILDSTFGGFECEAKICSPDDVCKMQESLEREIYAQSVLMGADSDSYSPRQLKLFCLEK
jgi:NADPH-dependent curcumin reductase CurA